jgi:phage terminase large subunit
LTDLVEWRAKENDLFKSSKKVYDRALRENCEVYYDNIGVGAGVGSNFNEMNDKKLKKVKHFKFTASVPPISPKQFYRIGKMRTKDKNKDYFENLKAQAWITFADKLKATQRALNGSINEHHDDIISISPDLPHLSELIKELSAPRRVISLNSKNAVEKKKDLLKRGIKSPNLADCVVMVFLDINNGGFGGSV